MNDQDTRCHIISKDGLNENIFLEANAGSGKTTILTERIVYMIENGIDITKICAVTFTKKAANEFYARILELLKARLNWDNVDDKLKGKYKHLGKLSKENISNIENALKNIDSCFLGTIDSFCLQIISEHPIDAEVPTNIRPLEEDELNRAYKDIYIDIKNCVYGNKIKDELDLMEYYFGELKEDFPKIFTNALFDRHLPINIDKKYLDENGDFKPFKDFVNQKDVSNYVFFCKDLLNTPYDKRNNDKKMKWYSLEKFISEYDDNGLIALLSEYNINFKELISSDKNNPYFYENGFYDVKSGLIKPSVHSSALEGKKEHPLLKTINDYKRNYFNKFLDDCLKVIPQKLKEEGVLDFFDILLYTRNLLKDDILNNNSKLVKYIRNKYRYFLLDEFQDTDPLEAEVFFYLSSDNPNAEYDKCIPDNGSLFIVGDPKQSIYRFKGADIDSYINIENLFKKNGFGVYKLSDNFRSSSELKTWFNDAFRKDFFTGIDYEDISNESTKVLGGISGVYKGINDDIPHLIDYLVNEKGYQYKDIMIITASTYSHNYLKGRLNKYPLKIEGKNVLSENITLSRIAAILRACLNSEEKYYIFNALEACGFYKFKLAELKSLGYSFTLEYKDEYKCEELKDFIDHINEVKKVSIYSMVEKIISEFDIFSNFNYEYLEEVYYFNESMIDSIRNNLLITNKQIIDYINSYFANRDKDIKERFSYLDKDYNAIDIANVHKVKGLQAKVVILYSTQKSKREPEKSIYNNERYFWGIKGEFGNLRVNLDDLKNDIRDVESIKLWEERERLLYVAATRAEDLLFVCEGANSYWSELIERINVDLPNNIKSYGITNDSGKDNFINFLNTTNAIYLLNNENDLKSKLIKNEEKYKLFKKFFINDENIKILLNKLKTSNIAFLDHDKSINKELSNNLLNSIDSINDSEEIVYALNNDNSEIILSDGSKTNYIKVVFDYDTSKDIYEIYILVYKNNPLTTKLDIFNDDLMEKTYKLVSPSKEDKNIKEKHLQEDEITVTSTLKEDLKDKKNSLIYGTIVHRLMEKIVNSLGKEINKVNLINSILNEFELNDDKDSKDLLNNVFDTMINGGYKQNNGVNSDLLLTLKNAKEIYCELPFSYKKDNNIISGYIDLLYKDNTGYHIIDYKTNFDDQDLDNKYDNQLNEYINALKETMNIDADANIYHISKI